MTRPKLLFAFLVVAALSVTLFSLLGIAALTGNMPFAHSAPAAPATAEGQERNDAEPDTAQAATGPAAASEACQACGTVLSIRPVETAGGSSGMGAVAGGLAGALLGNRMGDGRGRAVMTVLGGAGGAYAGNEIEKNARKSTRYRIDVRMEEGGVRHVYQQEPPQVSVGDRVRISNGTIVARS